MADDTTSYATMLHNTMEEFTNSLLLLKRNLTDIFGEGQDANQQLMISYVDETLREWKNLVEMQKVLSNKISQQALLLSIEITGFPENPEENLAGVAKVLSKLLRIAISECYVTDFKRIDELNDDQEIMYPRPLVVFLVDKNIKKRILTVAEMVTLKLPDSDVLITITEHLTPYNKKLLKKAREEAARRGISKVWVQDGNIYFQRNENSNIYEVRSESDIQTMSFL